MEPKGFLGFGLDLLMEGGLDYIIYVLFKVKRLEYFEAW